MSRRWWIALLGLVLVLAVATGIAWRSLPELARWVVIRQLESATGRRVTIERFELDLAGGRLDIGGLRVAAREPGPPVAELEHLEARFEPRSLVRGHLHVHEVALTGGRMRILRTEAGELNVADLLGRAEAGGPASPFAIDRFTLTDGVVTLEDRTLTPNRTWRAEGIAVQAADLSTAHPEPRGTARLTATVAGAPVSIDLSELRFSPLHLRGRLALGDVDATLAHLYAPLDTPVVLDRGVLSAELAGSFDAAEGARLEGQGRLEQVVLRRPGVKAPAATAPSLAFTLSGAGAPDGSPRLQRLEVTGSAAVLDARTEPATRFELDRLRLLVEAAEGAAPWPARVSLTAGLPGGGDLAVQGTAHPAPFRAELRANVRRVDLAFWAPHVPLAVELAGQTEADLAVDLAYSDHVVARVRGRSTVDRLAIGEGGRRIASAEQVELTGVDAQWPRVRVAHVRVTRPAAVVRRDRAGRIALPALFPPPGTRPPGARPGPPGPEVEIGEIAVDEGTLTALDTAVSPRARLAMSSLRLTARDVTWPARRPATVHLAGATPGAGSIEADGTVSLDPLRLDVRVRVAGAPVEPYRPYLPLGARVEGRLDADVAVAAALGPPTEVALRGTAGLSDLAVADRDQPLLRVGRLDTADLEYTWPATVRIGRLHVRRPWALLERRADGALPLLALLTPERAAESPPRRASPDGTPSSPGLELAVRETVLEDGAAQIVDGAVSPAGRIEIAGVRLVAGNLSWPARSPVAVELEATTPGGGALSARGEVDLVRPGLEMRIALNAADLAPARPYLPLGGRIAAKASVELELRATLDPLAIAARGTASLGDLAVADGDRPLLTAARVEAAGLEYTWPARLAIDELRIHRGWVLVERAADGAFALPALLAPPHPVAASSAPGPRAPGGVPAAPAVELHIGRGTVDDGAVTVVDGAVKPSARLEIRGAALTLQSLTWPARGATAIALRAPMPGGGTIEARGPLHLDTSSLDMRVALARVDLAPAQPYLPMRGRLGGTADADLRLSGSLAPLALSVAGRLAVSDATLGDGERTLASVKQVDITGLDAAWPSRIAIERVGLRGPWSLIERDADASLPLLKLLAPPAAPASARPVAGDRAATAEDGPVVQVGALAIEDGFFRFVDRSMSPSFVEEASAVAVTARGLGTAAGTRSPLAVSGQLTGRAPFQFDGTVGPVAGPLALDVQGKLSELSLPRVNSYVSRLLGWIARRGALDASVRYRVLDDQLNAANDIVVKQPEFVPSRRGDEVRERLGVPLGLLVSLLKDARGEVRLSVPVTGNISARQFDFGDAFWDAVRQTVIKVLALPVSWVGKIFYTADARIDTVRIWPVYFEPGTTRFRRGFDEQAERLATFLRDSPGVALVMKPVLTVDDLAALRREAVRQRLEALAAGAGPPGVAAAAARLFAERFPDRRVPPALDDIVEELARAAPSPDAAANALVGSRLELTRSRLEATGGVDASRLRTGEGPVPVEASGFGRVEFDFGS